MGTRWIPEAEDLKPVGGHNPMSGVGGPRATLHCTVSGTHQFNDMHRVLIHKRAEPHLLYSFRDDRLGQYFPLDRAARSLGRSYGMAYSNNRVGSVNIQVEVVGTVDDWTARSDWNPGPNFRAMMRAIRSWGIEPKPIYRFAQTAADRSRVVMDRTWLTSSKGGGRWWGHCHYPAPENHWDPGRVNVARFFAAAEGPLGSGGGSTTGPVAGGGATPGTVFEEDDLQLDDNIPTTATQKKVWGVEKVDVADALLSARYARLFAHRAQEDAAATLAIVKKMAEAGRPLTQEEIAAAVAEGVANAVKSEYEVVGDVRIQSKGDDA